MTITEKQVEDINNLLRHSVKPKLNANAIVYINDMLEDEKLSLLKEMYNDNRTWQEPIEVIQERIIDIMDKRVNKVFTKENNLK